MASSVAAPGERQTRRPCGLFLPGPGVTCVISAWVSMTRGGWGVWPAPGRGRRRQDCAMQGVVLFPPHPARGLDKVPLPPVVLMSFPSNPCQQCSPTSAFCSKQTGDKWCLMVTSLSLSQVQQSSFYGYTGMLPKRYTQGVMTGETRGPPHPQPSRKHFGAPRPDVLSLPSGPGWARLSRAVGQDSGTAGVMVSLSRILTKLLLPDERAGTLIFFLVSAGLELLCFLLHLLVRGSRFVLYHTARPRPSHTAGYRVHHDVAAEDVHFEHQGPGLANGGSPKDSPAHEVTGGGGAYTRFDVPRPRTRRSWPSFRALLLHRYVVARVIWADMLSIAVTYFITLCLFPGLESEIHHCILGEWLPILIMAVFNLSDFVGKILAALPMDWQGTHLLACACLRVVFIPLFILCVYPSSTPALRHPAWPCILSLLMGISNGYFGSVPMILAAGKVSPRQRELAGNTMTVSYMTGLTLGSAVAYCTYSLTRDAHGTCPDRSAANASFPAGL
ncbi:equilibrative nucleoside transporter 4 isoform X7 [Sagmatias obliquidens]|uniref:equilibrative nucleoside transporter 4 isoform X7 n=1 Tax=Sagmatias obliquidens TaxID=3371155 RepID=UPI000F443675|nr:equilibrative nucleoside transporter 4 isoform X7 [Lagenorhynchus obliquidens]